MVGCFGCWWFSNDARGFPERAFPFDTAYSGLSRFMKELEEIYEGRANYYLEVRPLGRGSEILFAAQGLLTVHGTALRRPLCLESKARAHGCNISSGQRLWRTLKLTTYAKDEIRRIHKNVYKHYKVPGQRG